MTYDPASFNTRRLSDKILMAFHQACDQDQIDTAEHLLRALELTVTNYGGQDRKSTRLNSSHVKRSRRPASA